MQIPKSFTLLAKTINVKQASKKCTKLNKYGAYYSTLNKILLADSLIVDNQEIKLPKDNIEHTFLHEATHAILQAMGEDELNDNEKFVDTFSGLLHQVLTTQKY